MTERNKLLAVLIVGLLVGFGIGRLIPGQGEERRVVDTTEPDLVNTDTGVTEDVAQTGSQLGASLVDGLKKSAIDRPQVQKSGMQVRVLDQVAGNQVLVASVVVDGPTWVTVQDDRDGIPGNVLGARRVDTKTDGLIVPLLRETKSKGTYYVLLQQDNGNEDYDLYVDPELVSLEGTLIYDAFVAQ